MKFKRKARFATYNIIMHRKENIDKRELPRYTFTYIFRRDYYVHPLSGISVSDATEMFSFAKSGPQENGDKRNRKADRIEFESGFLC